jgi:hypothetical protein
MQNTLGTWKTHEQPHEKTYGEHIRNMVGTPNLKKSNLIILAPLCDYLCNIFSSILYAFMVISTKFSSNKFFFLTSFLSLRSSKVLESNIGFFQSFLLYVFSLSLYPNVFHYGTIKCSQVGNCDLMKHIQVRSFY